MKTGWLVVNHFLATNKFTEHYDWLRKAAENVDIALILKTGVDLMNEIGQGLLSSEPLPDFVLFWDKDIRLASALENLGLKVFNNARAISLCDDKSLTHLNLAGQIPMPKTICAPMTYPAVGYPDVSFVKRAVEVLGLPMVIKECYGSFGFQVYLANTLEDAETLVKKLAGTPFIMQEFIDSSKGRDVRLQVVGKQVVAAMYRYNDQGDFRANITNGGKMKAYEPTEEQKELAVTACSILGLDFAGVDFLFGEHNEPILCEINSNAHFKNLYSCTGVNVAEAILDHIAKNI
ncbi:MAG: RimK family alpha-L-glutamate ligase [Ruminococcaceae bacterium]|nr:RimK family alpha-L-glutamate ligase [Oscillospiraceae bacterium]